MSTNELIAVSGGITCTEVQAYVNIHHAKVWPVVELQGILHLKEKC